LLKGNKHRILQACSQESTHLPRQCKPYFNPNVQRVATSFTIIRPSTINKGKNHHKMRSRSKPKLQASDSTKRTSTQDYKIKSATTNIRPLQLHNRLNSTRSRPPVAKKEALDFKKK